MIDLNLPAGLSWLPLAVGLVSVLGLGLVGGFVWGHRHARHRPLPNPELLVSTSPDGGEPDPWAGGSSGEQRQAQRRPGHPVAVLVSDAAAKVSPCQGLVTDRSLGGLRLTLDEPVAVATVLSVRPAASELIPWVQVEVMNCRRGDVGWEVGCRFLKVPPTSILWSFG